jgi:hypothetical protein
MSDKRSERTRRRICADSHRTRPARETGGALVLPEANAEAMNLHLAAISQQVSPGAFAVIV